jgi:hypothetical protein
MRACPENQTGLGLASPKTVCPERLAQCARLLSRQLERILLLVELEVGGEPVVPDSYASASNGSSVPDRMQSGVRYEALLSYPRNEARLEFIARTLGRSLHLGQFRAGARPLPVDGFRLLQEPDAQYEVFPRADTEKRQERAQGG